MKANADTLRARLKEKGYKLTFQRMSIYEALHRGPRHPTAEELHSYVSRKFPMIGLSTVYNALETLCELGQLSKVTIDSNATRYDIMTERHAHLICLECGRIDDITGLPCGHCKRTVEKTGFQVVGNSATEEEGHRKKRKLSEEPSATMLGTPIFPSCRNRPVEPLFGDPISTDPWA